jgi:hypothetical protein
LAACDYEEGFAMDGESHTSLTSIFTHVAIMAAVMAVSGSVMAAPMGVETNLVNSAAIGLNGAIDMMIVDPISSLGDYISNFSGVGELTYEWGSLNHHGGMDMAAHSGSEHVMTEGASHSAEHAAPSGPYTQHFADSFNSFAAEDGALSMLAEDCDSELLTCFSDEYYHPPGHH